MLEAVKSSDEANEFMEQYMQIKGRGYLKKIQGVRVPFDSRIKEEETKSNSKLLAADRQLARLNASGTGKTKTISLKE